MAYTSANVMNYLINGHWMHENTAGHTFEIQAGKTSTGKTRYIKWAGTAADFARLPYDIALSLAKGDLSSIGRVVRNRLAITLSTLSGFVFNVDYLGRPLFGRDRYGNPIPVGQQVGAGVGQVSNLFLPQYGQALVDLVSGRSDLEQATTQGLELPFRYTNPPKAVSGRYDF